MSNLDNLISKIIRDSDAKSKELVNSASTKAAEIIQKCKQEGARERDKILAEAKIEAQKAVDQIMTSKKLSIRNENLNAKSEIINKVFDSALEALNSLPKQDFLVFLKNGLASAGTKDGELVLPSSYGINDISAINKELNSNFNLSTGNREISGGFVLITGGIERNFTFESMIQYNRDELESEIIAKLF